MWKQDSVRHTLYSSKATEKVCKTLFDSIFTPLLERVTGLGFGGGGRSTEPREEVQLRQTSHGERDSAHSYIGSKQIQETCQFGL